ncbi:hypothetical protein SAMN05216167_101902 [Spirosoma endophyticum]|uniref:Uncharacterized protein n=1 Tax=Spirosoma endophyticum TaxID=662367 RepID=A0A1I1IC26_9BACT|nr:hypothetical protein SAMN05216167_101902 [Spirosoma endophyticum]
MGSPKARTRINPAALVFELNRSCMFGKDYRHSYMIVAD